MFHLATMMCGIVPQEHHSIAAILGLPVSLNTTKTYAEKYNNIYIYIQSGQHSIDITMSEEIKKTIEKFHTTLHLRNGN